MLFVLFKLEFAAFAAWTVFEFEWELPPQRAFVTRSITDVLPLEPDDDEDEDEDDELEELLDDDDDDDEEVVDEVPPLLLLLLLP